MRKFSLKTSRGKQDVFNDWLLSGTGYDCGEKFGVMFGQGGEDFPIKHDAFLFEAVDEGVVWESCLACGCIDLYLPQAAHFAFSFTAAAEFVAPRVKKRFPGEPFFRFAAPHKSLGVFEYFFSFFEGSNSPFDAWHGI